MKTQTYRTRLLQASVALAERAIHLTALSRLQSDLAWPDKLFQRAVRCQRFAVRLLQRGMEATQ